MSSMSERDAFILKGEGEFALHNCKRLKRQAKDMALIAKEALSNASELYREKTALMKSTIEEINNVDFDEDGHFYETFEQPNGEWQLKKAWNKNRRGKITMMEFDRNGNLIKEVEQMGQSTSISTLNKKTGKMDNVSGYASLSGRNIHTISMGYEKTQDGFIADEVYNFSPELFSSKLMSFNIDYSKTKDGEKAKVSYDLKDYLKDGNKFYTCSIDSNKFKNTTTRTEIQAADEVFSYGIGGFCRYSTGVKYQAGTYLHSPTTTYKEDYSFGWEGELTTYEKGKSWTSGRERRANSVVEFKDGKVADVYKNQVAKYADGKTIIKSESEFHF